MHINKPLFKDGTCWVRNVLTPPDVIIFSRRCRRRFRRRWRCIDRVSHAPKLLLVVWVSAQCFRCVLAYGLRAVMWEPYKGLYKNLYFIMNITTGFLYHFCSFVRTSYWSRDWYGKHSGFPIRGSDSLHPNFLVDLGCLVGFRCIVSILAYEPSCN